MSNWREMLREAKELFDDGFIDEDEYKQLKAEALTIRSQEKGTGQTPAPKPPVTDTFAGTTSFSDTFRGETQFSAAGFSNVTQSKGGELGEIGQYLLIEEIGKGGMGNVYRAKHKVETYAKQTGDVAIKLMKSELAGDEEFRNRFISEAFTGRTLFHENIAKIYDVIPERDGRLGLVMELVDGKELQELIPSEGMDLQAALPIIKQIVAGVEYLHQNNVIHRDLKPENIMVSAQGEVKILDMGIAKNTAQENITQTQTGTALGTPVYMAPEQLNAKNVAPSADAYAVGLIVYKMLSGHLPWDKSAGAGDILAAKFGGQLKPFAGKNAFVAMIVMEMLSVMVGSRPSLANFLQRLSVSPEKQRQLLEKETLRALQIWADRLERQIREISQRYLDDKDTLLALSTLSYKKQWLENPEDWKSRLEKTEQNIPRILQEAELRNAKQKELLQVLTERAEELEKLLINAKEELKDVPEFQLFCNKISLQRKNKEALEKWQTRLQELHSAIARSIEQGHQRLIEMEREKEQEEIRLEQARIKREEAKKEAEKNKKKVAALEQQLMSIRAKYAPIIQAEAQKKEELLECMTEKKKEYSMLEKETEEIETELKNFEKKRGQAISKKKYYQEQIQKKEVDLYALRASTFVFGKADKITALQNDIYALHKNLEQLIEIEAGAAKQRREILERRKIAKTVITAKNTFEKGLQDSLQELEKGILEQQRKQEQEENTILGELQELAQKGKEFRSEYLDLSSPPSAKKQAAQKSKSKPKQEKSKQSEAPFHAKEMVLIPKGAFLMGALPTDPSTTKTEHPQHTVHISRDYWIGKYPVTQGFWEEVMGHHDAKFRGQAHPVEKVAWNTCLAFCNKLSEKEGLQPVYSFTGSQVHCNWDASGYRLPTEAEWEKAARGGRNNQIFSGLNTPTVVAWYHNNSEQTTHPVGQKQPNGYGIYDMSGNVWEWCWDYFDKNAYQKRAKKTIDPRGPDFGKERVNRGGSWYSAESATRVSFRCGDQPFVANSFLGFRIVRLDK